MKAIIFDFFPENVIAGYSSDCDGSWHYNSPDDYANYELLAKELGISVNHIIRVRENHTDNVITVDSSNGGEGVIKDGTPGYYDGIITNAENLMLCIVTADCVPVFLFDSDHGAVGIVHSGKDGTVKEIVAKAVFDMENRFNTDPTNLQCILGPYISQKHYQLQKKDLVAFNTYFSSKERDRFIQSEKDGYIVDLGEAISITLEKAGLKRSNIFNCHTCTFENHDLFSFRRDRTYKHLISFIMLKNENHEK